MSPRFHRVAAVSLLIGCAPSPRGDGKAAVAPTTAPATTTAPLFHLAELPPDAGYAPELVSFKSGALTLGGFLWRPQGNGPFPVIVFNHGSEEYPGAKDGQAKFFVPHGFVLFVPHRRGQGRSKAAGRYINEFYDAAARDSSDFVDALVAQNDDVTAAVSYVASLPYVDPKRIAMSGCSLGGIESLLSAERGTGLVAAIDFAGAAATWATNVPLQERMKTAARNAQIPVFFIQAQNDYDTTPSLVLSDVMKGAGKPVSVHVFGPVGKTPDDGHSFCTGGTAPDWGPEVLEFLRNAMPSPK
jgi:carboxymethylenebutenolidase